IGRLHLFLICGSTKQEEQSVKQTARIQLSEERKRRQWSQQEVADVIGTTQRTVSRWELGLMTPGPYFRTKLCTLFGKSPQELGLFEGLEGEEPLPDPPALENARLWHVPFPRNPFFTGREEILQVLHEHIRRKGSLALTQS